MAIIEGAQQRGCAKFQYDFALLGGSKGDIVLIGTPLPKNAVIMEGVVDVITPITGGATVAVTTSQSANDLISAAADTGEPWVAAGIKALVPVGAAANAIKLTADRAPKIVVTVADITAGKFNLFIEYYLSD